MQVINNEHIIAVDIDNTLATWDEPTIPGPHKIKVTYADQTVYLTPHEYHIQLVKTYKNRGFFMIAWSHNGRKHAEQVIKKLKLEKYIDIVMAKLTKHVDDSENSNSVVGPRIYEKNYLKPV